MDKDIQILEDFIKDFFISYPQGCNIINMEIEAIRHLLNKCKSQEKQIKLMQSINIPENFVEKTKLYKLIEKLEEDEKYYDKSNMDGYARATGRAIDMLTEIMEEE